jgi:hypothetical protein
VRADAKPENSIICSAKELMAPGGNLFKSKSSGYTTDALMISSSASAEELPSVLLYAATLSNSEKVNSLNTISDPFYFSLKY